MAEEVFVGFTWYIFALGHVLPALLMGFFYSSMLLMLRQHRQRTTAHSRIPIKRVILYTVLHTQTARYDSFKIKDQLRILDGDLSILLRLLDALLGWEHPLRPVSEGNDRHLRLLHVRRPCPPFCQLRFQLVSLLQRTWDYSYLSLESLEKFSVAVK